MLYILKNNLSLVFAYLLKNFLWLLLFSFVVTCLELFFKINILLKCRTGIKIEPKTLISIIVIAPILEELVFRMGLTYNRKDFVVSILFSIVGLV
jgi:membrane protease YdiL (CAAX protease family)